MVLLALAGDDDVVHICEYISANLPFEHCFGKPGEGGPGVLESLRHSDEAISAEGCYKAGASLVDRKSTRLNSSHSGESRMPSSA